MSSTISDHCPTGQRAVARFELRPRDLLEALVLVAALSTIWLACLPTVLRCWQWLFELCIPRFRMSGHVAYATYALVHLDIPFPSVDAGLPDWPTWRTTALATVALLLGIRLLPARATPLKYLVGAIALVNASALGYFALVPARFPHTAASYLAGLASAAVALISLVPALHGLAFYLFPYPLRQKVMLTGLSISYLALFVPLQLLLHAWILERSVIFMPVLFVAFGIAADVLILICFYSWGMSWRMGTSS